MYLVPCSKGGNYMRKIKQLVIVAFTLALLLISFNVTTNSKKEIVVLDEKPITIRPFAIADPGGGSG